MDSDKKEAVNFVIWGIGLIGIGAFLVVAINLILTIFTGREFYLMRNIIVAVVGIICLYFSKRKLSK